MQLQSAGTLEADPNQLRALHSYGALRLSFSLSPPSFMLIIMINTLTSTQTPSSQRTHSPWLSSYQKPTLTVQEESLPGERASCAFALTWRRIRTRLLHEPRASSYWARMIILGLRAQVTHSFWLVFHRKKATTFIHRVLETLATLERACV